MILYYEHIRPFTWLNAWLKVNTPVSCDCHVIHKPWYLHRVFPALAKAPYLARDPNPLCFSSTSEYILMFGASFCCLLDINIRKCSISYWSWNCGIQHIEPLCLIGSLCTCFALIGSLSRPCALSGRINGLRYIGKVKANSRYYKMSLTTGLGPPFPCKQLDNSALLNRCLIRNAYIGDRVNYITVACWSISI